MSELTTGLDLVVGSLITVRPDEDEELFSEDQESIALVQDQLRAEGIAVDLLARPGEEVWTGGIESVGALYQLTRLIVALERKEDIMPVIEDGPVMYDEPDEGVNEVLEDPSKTRFPHVICLQDYNGYYLPTDFPSPIWLIMKDEDGEEDTHFFGSSVRLQQETATLKEMLQQADVSPQSTAYRTLESLHEAANQSIQHTMPIIIW